VTCTTDARIVGGSEDLREEQLRALLPGTLEEVFRRTDLDDLTVGHEHDAVGDLAVGESFTYSCTVGNLNGIIFENTAIAIGTPTIGPDVTATSSATVRPVLDTTVTTQPPDSTTTTTVAGTSTSTTLAPTTTGSPTETLPVTGVDSERLQGFGIVGIGLVFAGVALLGGAALIGRMRDES